MTRRVLLLGCGAQGRAVLHDLLLGDDAVQVVVADREQSAGRAIRGYAESRVEAKVVDATGESAIAALMRDAGVVVESLPGPFALPMARLAAHCGVSLVSSMDLRDP